MRKMSKKAWEQLSSLFQGLTLLLIGSGLADLLSQVSKMTITIGCLIMPLGILSTILSIYFANKVR